MSNRPPINLTWTAIGAAIIIGLNQVGTMVLAPPLVPSLVESMGPTGGILVFAAILAVFSFFIGGLVVGWMSPGETLMEPAVASVAAIAVNAILNNVHEQGALSALGLGIAAIVGFGLGLLGAKVGERVQGDTTEKMRERGEL